MHGERIFAITKLTKVWSACTSREIFEECYMIIIHVCLVVLNAFEKYGGENCSKPRKSIITHPWGHIKWKESFSWKFDTSFFEPCFYASFPLGKLGFQDLRIRGEKWSHGYNRFERPKKNLDFCGILQPPNWWVKRDPTGDPSPGSPSYGFTVGPTSPLRIAYHPTPRWWNGTSKTLQMWEDRWECLSPGTLFFGGNHPKMGWTPKHSSVTWIC